MRIRGAAFGSNLNEQPVDVGDTSQGQGVRATTVLPKQLETIRLTCGVCMAAIGFGQARPGNSLEPLCQDFERP